jgi:hypothetical protein
MSTYAEFLARKSARAPEVGISVSAGDLHPELFDWQREIVSWACRVGRAAIWADTGLGKTFMQLAWLDQMAGPFHGLIVAPFAICHQTAYIEAPKLGIDVEYVRDPSEMSEEYDGLYITNYEMLDRFDPAVFDAVVLDEASILKQSDGKMRRALIEWAKDVPYRLACTATPAPNDPEELTNQAEFLGQMTRVNMLASYFVHDQDGWRLKGHAREPMMRWMATWALAIRRPSDLGDYSDEGYDLPGLEIVPEIVSVDREPEPDELFAASEPLGGVGGRAKLRRETLQARVERAAKIISAEPDEPWLVWCGLNDEAEQVARLTGGLNVHGALSPEDKAAGLRGFADGSVRILITKPRIASQGLNYQHCARMVFVGLNDSWEQLYQASRRCHRYGQTRVVRAHVVISDAEAPILANVTSKGDEAERLTEALVAAMRESRMRVAS